MVENFHDRAQAAPVDPQTAALKAFVQSLAGENQPLQQVVGFAQAELMEMARELARCIQATLSERPSGLEAFSEAAPVMDMHLRYHRLFERYQQLAVKQALSREQSAGRDLPQ